MKRLLSGASALAVAVAYFVLSALPAFSADTGTVDAQVTVAAPCITLDVTAIDFGSLPFGAENAQANVGVNINNCASSDETIHASGTNASNGSGVTWTLSDSPTSNCDLGTNIYKFGVVARESSTDPSSKWSLLFSTSNKSGGTLAAGDTDMLDHRLYTPCSGSDGAGTAFTMQAVYTATL